MWVPSVKDIEEIAKQHGKLLTVKENATVAEAAKKMKDNQIGCLVVFDMQNNFTGVLTERDMLAKVLTTSTPADTLLAGDIMTTNPISCTMDTPIAETEQLMAEHKIRHLPIVENGTPTGMVSSRDVIAYRLRSNKAMKTAAEQLAMLSTGLKSLDFDDVIDLAINEVPKSFQAEYSVLYLAQQDSSQPLIYRKGCPHHGENLFNPEEMKQFLEKGQVISDKVCSQGKKLCKQASKLLIPLNIHDHCSNRDDGNTNMQGFLCMCGFAQSSTGSEESQLYKASLLQEVLNVNLTNAKLYKNYQKARQDSEIDSLTGVGTRRVLEKVLKAEHARAARYNHPFSVAIVDIDKFKEINDSAGHAAGDKALKQLAKVMRHTARTTDIIITRYGGDEFVLLMPETKIKGAKVLLERIRRQVKNISIPNVESISISSGLAEWTGSAEDDPDSILKRADSALYEAKRKGRNRVITYQPAENNS
jgi:diguanylate cyclase (GGDEF)-like protein